MIPQTDWTNIGFIATVTTIPYNYRLGVFPILTYLYFKLI